MMKYKIERTTRFKRDYKLIVKRNYDIKLLEEVVRVLQLELRHDTMDTGCKK